MIIYALSYAKSSYVGIERLQFYTWVPVGPEQRIPGLVYSDTPQVQSPGETVTFDVYPSGSVSLVSLGQGRYREQTRKEKEDKT